MEIYPNHESRSGYDRNNTPSQLYVPRGEQWRRDHAKWCSTLSAGDIIQFPAIYLMDPLQLVMTTIAWPSKDEDSDSDADIRKIDNSNSIKDLRSIGVDNSNDADEFSMTAADCKVPRTQMVPAASTILSDRVALPIVEVRDPCTVTMSRSASDTMVSLGPNAEDKILIRACISAIPLGSSIQESIVTFRDSSLHATNPLPPSSIVSSSHLQLPVMSKTVDENLSRSSSSRDTELLSPKAGDHEGNSSSVFHSPFVYGHENCKELTPESTCIRSIQAPLLLSSPRSSPDSETTLESADTDTTSKIAQGKRPIMDIYNKTEPFVNVQVPGRTASSTLFFKRKARHIPQPVRKLQLDPGMNQNKSQFNDSWPSGAPSRIVTSDAESSPTVIRSRPTLLENCQSTVIRSRSTLLENCQISTVSRPSLPVLQAVDPNLSPFQATQEIVADSDLIFKLFDRESNSANVV